MKVVAFERAQGRLRWAVLLALGLAGIQGCSLIPDKAQAPAEPPVTAVPPAAKAVPQPEPESPAAPEPPVAEALPVQEETVQEEPLATTQTEVTAAGAASEVEHATPPAEAAPAALPDDPNTFLVTMAAKDARHPAYGKGHELGFLVNGQPGKTLVLVRGQTYRFDVRTDPKHDFYLSTRPDGWGGGVYSHGVKGQFTYRGVVEFTPDEQTPDVLYYQCFNHKHMGGKLVIVDPGTDVAALERQLAEEAVARRQTQGEVAHQVDARALEKAKQKIAYGRLLLRIKGTAIPDADRKRIEEEFDRAQNALDAGHGVEALRLAEKAGAELQAATSGKLSSETRVAYKNRFDELMAGVEEFARVHSRTVEQMQKEKAEAVEYDRMKVDGLVAEAKSLAAQDRWQEANDTLRLAQREINAAINAMLHEKTVVYDKDFETPEEEYQYELSRFESYLELIPVAIEQKRPSKGALSLIERYRDKGVSLRDQAKERAAGGDYENAILMLQAATSNVRRSLRMAGVSM